MSNNHKLEKLKSQQFLSLWGKLPNPDNRFLSRNGNSPSEVLSGLSYTAEILACILARESAVMGDPWEIVADNEKTAELVTANLNKIGANTLFRNIFHAVWYGFTVLEHPMEKVNGKWEYKHIGSLPNHWFAFNGQSELIPSNHTDTSAMNTAVGDIEKEVELVQYRQTFINPYGEGLLARVFWYATYIRGDLELWISYLDRFGDDSVVGKTDILNEEKKMSFLSALQEFKGSGAIVIDNSDEIDIIKTDKTGSSSMFKDFHTLCCEQISKLFLGHSSALEAQAGKLGNDEGLSTVRQDITQDDKTLIEEVVNRLIKHLLLVNGIKDDARFFFSPEKEDEKARIERDEKLVGMGYELSEEYIRRTYRFGDNDIKRTEQKPAEFSEGVENGKKLEEYYRDLDAYTDSRVDDFIKSFDTNKLIDGIQKCEVWEDAVESVLRADFKTDNFALDLLHAYAIGRSQVVDKVNKKAEFSEQGEVLFSTFNEAGEYFRARFDLTPDKFNELSAKMKKYAFTVSGIAKEDVMAEISKQLLKAYDEGESFYSFEKALRSGKFKKDIEALEYRHLKLVYSQNMSSAYAYGRYQGLMGAVEFFPNWVYVTIGDDRVRDSHRILNGVIRRYDDPFWKEYYPPNGFKCRCIAEISYDEPSGTGSPVQDGYGLGFGFEHSVGDMTGWVKDRISQMSAVVGKLPTRTSFFSNSKPMHDWDVNKDVLSAGKDYSELKNGLELAEKKLKTDIGDIPTLLDKKRNVVGFDTKNLIEHISTTEKKGKRVFDEVKWKSRAGLVDNIKDIIETGTIIEDVERYGKSKQIVITRKYVKNVKLNGENTPVMLIAEYPKDEKNSIPVLTTIYPINGLKNTVGRTGIIIK